MLAGIFSLAILFLVKHPNLLQASVLNAGEISLIQKNKRDIAYKQSTWLLDIFFASSTKQKPITLILAHNPLMSLDWSSFSGQCDFTLLDANQETTSIILDCPAFDSEQSVLLIPFVGKPQDILIEEGYYIDGDIKQYLSIGNLSLPTEHSN